MDRKYALVKFEEAASLLPESIRKKLWRLPEQDKVTAEEIRLRAGVGVTVLSGSGEVQICPEVNRQELDCVIENGTEASAHSVRESLKYGYLTAVGGHRIGLCGTAIVKDGEIAGFRMISSLSLRIAKEVRGIGCDLYSNLYRNSAFYSTLIISPPGGGKTTLLRDLIRLASNAGFRVSLADERGELAAMRFGCPQTDIGRHTDVLDLCPRAEAVMFMLRAMNPEIIAMDEITDPKDLIALQNAQGCGVKLIATAHGQSKDGLRKRRLYAKMLDSGLFERLIVIEKDNGERRYCLEELS